MNISVSKYKIENKQTYVWIVWKKTSLLIQLLSPRKPINFFKREIN